jgi:hypothetical protein
MTPRPYKAPEGITGYRARWLERQDRSHLLAWFVAMMASLPPLDMMFDMDAIREVAAKHGLKP